MKQIDQLAQVTLIGTGLLGGSIGLALKQRGYTGRIVGVGRRQSTLDQALEQGCIDHGTLDMAEALAPIDSEDSPDSPAYNLVILCTALGAFPTLLEQVARHDHDALLFTDVGSVKGFVMEAAATHLPDATRFVGSHPMAGSEQRGPTAAQADLFVNRPCIVTPMEDTNAAVTSAVSAFWERLGMRVARMTAARHDAKVAMASHLPHALAATMIELVRDHGAFDVASTGLRDTSRVASGDPKLWGDIFQTNREALLEAIEYAVVSLNELYDAIAEEDREDYETWLADMKQVRDAWCQGQIPGQSSSNES